MFRKGPNSSLDRVKFELRATGIKPDQVSPLRTGIHTRGYLPHVKREGARYFVTFRLADSLPRDVFFKIQAERVERLTAFHVQKSAAEKLGTVPPSRTVLDEIERDYHRKLESYLDQGHGECWLREPEIAGWSRTGFAFSSMNGMS